MGYVIEYGCGSGVKSRVGKKKRHWPKIFAVMVVLLTVVQGRTVLRDLILPGDGAVTAEALQILADDLQAGEPFSDAVTTFCQHILAESGQ